MAAFSFNWTVSASTDCSPQKAKAEKKQHFLNMGTTILDPRSIDKPWVDEKSQQRWSSGPWAGAGEGYVPLCSGENSGDFINELWLKIFFGLICLNLAL